MNYNYELYLKIFYQYFDLDNCYKVYCKLFFILYVKMVILKVFFLLYIVLEQKYYYKLKYIRLLNVILVKIGDIIKLVFYIIEEVKLNILNWKFLFFKLI